ncbi:Hypothetical protein A7982_11197 [Minicystis rosea]|nr:Hypothetical protein A7982_11197 [Minicystis rosea]
MSLDAAVTVRARLAADPRTAALVPSWDDWIADWKKTFLKEIDHRIAVVSANAVATKRDEDLDDISAETWAATAGDEAERFFYYKGKTNHQFTAPRLGGQYQQMGAWITHMAASKDPRINDIGARLAISHKEAGDAIQAVQEAETGAHEFRTTGERRQLVDKYNALGKSTEGTLKEMPHAHPELRLPNDFVERFMRAGRSVGPKTVEDLTRRRDELKEQYDQAQAELDAAVKGEQDAAAEAARIQRVAEEKKLAEAQAQLDAKNKEVAELRAKLGLPAEPEKP